MAESARYKLRYFREMVQSYRRQIQIQFKWTWLFKFVGGWCLRLHHNSCLCFYPLQVGRGPELRVILRYSQQNHWHNTGHPKKRHFLNCRFAKPGLMACGLPLPVETTHFKKRPRKTAIQKVFFFGTPCSSILSITAMWYKLISNCHNSDHLVKPACMFTSQPKTDPKLVTPTCLANNIQLWDKCSVTITSPTLANNHS